MAAVKEAKVATIEQQLGVERGEKTPRRQPWPGKHPTDEISALAIMQEIAVENATDSTCAGSRDATKSTPCLHTLRMPPDYCSPMIAIRR